MNLYQLMIEDDELDALLDLFSNLVDDGLHDEARDADEADRSTALGKFHVKLTRAYDAKRRVEEAAMAAHQDPERHPPDADDTGGWK